MEESMENVEPRGSVAQCPRERLGIALMQLREHCGYTRKQVEQLTHGELKAERVSAIEHGAAPFVRIEKILTYTKVFGKTVVFNLPQQDPKRRLQDLVSLAVQLNRDFTFTFVPLSASSHGTMH